MVSFWVGPRADAGAMKDLAMLVHESLSRLLFDVEDAVNLMTIRRSGFAAQARAGADMTVLSEVVIYNPATDRFDQVLDCFTDIAVSPRSTGRAEVNVLKSECFIQ